MAEIYQEAMWHWFLVCPKKNAPQGRVFHIDWDSKQMKQQLEAVTLLIQPSRLNKANTAHSLTVSCIDSFT